MNKVTRAWQQHGICAGCHSNQHSQFDCQTNPLCSRCGHSHPQQSCTVRAGVVRPEKPVRHAKRKEEEDAEVERQKKLVYLLERENQARRESLALDCQLAQRATTTSFAAFFSRPSLGQQTRQPAPPFWNHPRSKNPVPVVNLPKTPYSAPKLPSSKSDTFPPPPARKGVVGCRVRGSRGGCWEAQRACRPFRESPLQLNHQRWPWGFSMGVRRGAEDPGCSKFR
jgi:hypothetical protein